MKYLESRQRIVLPNIRLDGINKENVMKYLQKDFGFTACTAPEGMVVFSSPEKIRDFDKPSPMHPSRSLEVRLTQAEGGIVCDIKAKTTKSYSPNSPKINPVYLWADVEFLKEKLSEALNKSYKGEL